MEKTCIVCNNGENKYKCPACRQPYCSLICYKTHKEKCVPLPKEDNPKVETNVESKDLLITNDTVEEDKLNVLNTDKTLKELLKNPHLRNLLKQIDECDDAEVAMQKAMLEPIFVEFADACLKIVEPQNNPNKS